MNTRRSPKTPTADWLVGGGEMGKLIREHAWSATPLGSAETGPQSLRSAVSILLPSKAQIVLFWGPELITIYNDAYAPSVAGPEDHARGPHWLRRAGRPRAGRAGRLRRTPGEAGRAHEARRRPRGDSEPFLRMAGRPNDADSG